VTTAMDSQAPLNEEEECARERKRVSLSVGWGVLI